MKWLSDIPAVASKAIAPGSRWHIMHCDQRAV